MKLRIHEGQQAEEEIVFALKARQGRICLCAKTEKCREWTTIISLVQCIGEVKCGSFTHYLPSNLRDRMVVNTNGSLSLQQSPNDIIIPLISAANEA